MLGDFKGWAAGVDDNTVMPSAVWEADCIQGQVNCCFWKSPEWDASRLKYHNKISGALKYSDIRY